MMYINPKVVKTMLDVQFKKFYGPEVDKEVATALASHVTAREDTVETMDRIQIANNNVREASAATERCRTDSESTPPAELARKKIKLLEVERMEDDPVASKVGDEATAGKKPSTAYIEITPPPEPAKRKTKHTEPDIVKEEIETTGPGAEEGGTYGLPSLRISRQSIAREKILGWGDDIASVNESVRHPSIIRQRSQTATPTLGPKKKAKLPSRIAARVANSAYKGQRTRKGFKSCIATLTSKEVAEEWEILLKKPKSKEIHK
jgi:hypothetical protein